MSWLSAIVTREDKTDERKKNERGSMLCIPCKGLEELIIFSLITRVYKYTIQKDKTIHNCKILTKINKDILLPSRL